ncbi:Hsp20/alpha crystallin family protein [Bizionia gelidisalsuginis]|uniref:Hsp20/alpha crystallin family protein n=1 Tax=Bizionia gelidisalsuginis TaxID=291188 RepID=A0ABY3M8I2_9FLAO|nr:Hsp20/alpha crystallin family protein [Bizionia gelidisalsuginis]TYC10550.1 Hsp20/alpha crystallin family protein [Bizionia gelidisalsuginis]
MSLVKFNRRPLRNLITSDFFNNDDFFDTRLWNKKLDEPALNVKETNDAFEVELAAPGFAKKDFEVTIDNGCLHIAAESSKSKEEKEDNYTRQEFSYNSFEKRLQLPDSVKEEDVKATYNDGVLSFNLAKKADAKKHTPKKVEIG